VAYTRLEILSVQEERSYIAGNLPPDNHSVAGLTSHVPALIEHLTALSR
jgi:hypothetical protein